MTGACLRLGPGNKDIQVMYTVFIWDGIYRIKLFWQLSTDFRFPLCPTLTANDPEVALKNGFG